MSNNWHPIEKRYLEDPDFRAEVDAVMEAVLDPIPIEMTTICSTMFCYNRAKETNDPAHPPFCEQCQERKKGKTG